jgi:hypothetical protein
MALEFTTSYLEDSIHLLRYYKKLAESAIAQATDSQLYQLLDEDANSIAIIMQHMAGNMKSRWTNFLSEDGEKPWRNRDSEFEQPPTAREALLQMWEEGWNCLFQALESLTDADISRSVHSRRGSFCHAGHQPPGGTLSLPLRPDYSAGETFPA